MTDIAVCRGLHRALRQLRDKEVEREEQMVREWRDATGVDSDYERGEVKRYYWVPYIHFGVQMLLTLSLGL
ncbi:hypothetical protein F4815DRAFT_459745 [Daldinia loculata]|nr:hypothetical protein F4815DRAFT_459745 [Daldinia loculata]